MWEKTRKEDLVRSSRLKPHTMFGPHIATPRRLGGDSLFATFSTRWPDLFLVMGSRLQRAEWVKSNQAIFEKWQRPVLWKHGGGENPEISLGNFLAQTRLTACVCMCVCVYVCQCYCRGRYSRPWPLYIYILVTFLLRSAGVCPAAWSVIFITMCNIYMLSLRCLSCIYTSGAAQLSLGLSRSSDNFTIFREVYKLFGNWHMDVF